MQQVFDTVVDRTRSRLDVPKIRTIFGTAQRPRRTRKQLAHDPPVSNTRLLFALRLSRR